MVVKGGIKEGNGGKCEENILYENTLSQIV